MSVCSQQMRPNQNWHTWKEFLTQSVRISFRLFRDKTKWLIRICGWMRERVCERKIHMLTLLAYWVSLMIRLNFIGRRLYVDKNEWEKKRTTKQQQTVCSPTMYTHNITQAVWNQSIEIHLTPIQGQIVLSYAITGNHSTHSRFNLIRLFVANWITCRWANLHALLITQTFANAQCILMIIWSSNHIVQCPATSDTNYPYLHLRWKEMNKYSIYFMELSWFRAFSRKQCINYACIRFDSPFHCQSEM